MTNIKEWVIAIAITFMLVMAVYGVWIMTIVLIIVCIAYGIKVSQEIDRK